jgi:hypothetical protein
MLQKPTLWALGLKRAREVSFVMYPHASRALWFLHMCVILDLGTKRHATTGRRIVDTWATQTNPNSLRTLVYDQTIKPLNVQVVNELII